MLVVSASRHFWAPDSWKSSFKSKFNQRDLQSMNHNNWIYQGTTAIEPFASTVSQFAQSLRMPLFLLCLFCFLIAISIISPASETSAIHKHLEDHFGLGGVQSITDALVVPRKTREVTFLYFLSVILYTTHFCSWNIERMGKIYIPYYVKSAFWLEKFVAGCGWYLRIFAFLWKEEPRDDADFTRLLVWASLFPVQMGWSLSGPKCYLQ